MIRNDSLKRRRPAASRVRAAAIAALLAPLVSVATPAQPPTAAGQGPVEAFLRSLYAPYATSSMTTHNTVWDRPEKAFTPIAAATLRTTFRNEESDALDGDAICDCQDWTRLTVDRIIVRSGAQTAEAFVRFHDVREPPRTVHYKLAHVGGAWRVADIQVNDGPASRWLMPMLRAENAGRK